MRRFLIALLCLLIPLVVKGNSGADAFTDIAPAYPMPDSVRALIAVAAGEVGYAEERGGVTKYGSWYGNPAAEWCAEFLCWSVAQAEEALGVTLLNKVFPLYGATNIGREWFLAQGRYIARTGFVTGWGSQWYSGDSKQMARGSYIPQPGDWVFFSYTPSGDTTHVAVVEKVIAAADGTHYAQVIEGNNPDKVQRARYLLDDWRIQGYGTVHDLADIVLRGGKEGSKVRALQGRLADIGLIAYTDISGKYDHRTQEAVRAFQAEMGFAQTGIANQQTQLKLNAYAHQWVMEHTEFWTVDGAVH
ncbi:MAG: peptidoglycan-binding protein [Eubacteriales bacterium]|nr:peptidoglycan-binding protein [Eubacteriales bacterium]MDD4134202.1 peptidoglycan-binding protein [Eubacteriales bacterium]